VVMVSCVAVANFLIVVSVVLISALIFPRALELPSAAPLGFGLHCWKCAVDVVDIWRVRFLDNQGPIIKILTIYLMYKDVHIYVCT
jgi:hypothetical protein